MTPSPHPSSQHGFTIVEVITAVLIMTICLFPLGRMLMQILMESGDDQHIAVCAYLAVEEIETVRLRSECYTEGSTCPTTATTDGWGAANIYNRAAPCNYPAPFQRYQCAVQYKDSQGDGNNVREVMVRVWFDADDDKVWDAQEPDVILQTMLSKRPPIP